MKKIIPLTNIDPSRPVLAFLSLKLIVRDKGTILFLHDSDAKNGLDLPGGRVNSEEWKDSLLSTLNREVKEELGEAFKIEIDPKPQHIGIHSQAGRFFEDNTPSRTFYALYEGVYKGGDIKLSEEHSGHEWINIKDLDIKDKMLSEDYGNSLQEYFDSLK